MIIIIILLSVTLLLFSNANMLLDKDYKELQDNLNSSNNETIIKCKGEYRIVSLYDFYICDKLNGNILIKN